MRTQDFDQIETDVLVVGGGLAALRAALDARRAGARVTVAVKGKLGRSGSSAMTSAGYSSAIGEEDSPQIHLRDTLAGGRALNESDLVAIMAEEAPSRLDELLELGGVLATEDGARVVHPSGDHSVPRTVVAAGFRGLDFTLPLADAVVAAGCEVLEQTMVADLLLADGELAGAIGLGTGAGALRLVAVAAPAVILATGGCGQLFEVTSNPSDVTGDGYAMALRAGAVLRDMEFIQFYPWRCIVPFGKTRMPIQPSTFVLGARLYNADGERFMTAYDPERHEATTRDVAARGIYDQIRFGKDIQGGVRLDISGLSDADWERSNVKPHSYFAKRGIDPRSVEMILAPEAHFFMGGVVVDEQGASSIPGLYAAGENAGGVHGANRLDSNAIPETQVFGARAGRAAAEFAAARGARRPAPASLAADWTARRAAGDGAAVDHVELRRALQRCAWQKLGIVRDAQRLADGLEEVDAIENALTTGTVACGHAERVELENLIAVARACFSAALRRIESRGAHYRIDFPEQDDRWAHPLLLTQRAGRIVTEDATTEPQSQEVVRA